MTTLSMQPPSDVSVKKSRKFELAILASLLVHFLTVTTLNLINRHEREKALSLAKEIEINFIEVDRDKTEKNRQVVETAKTEKTAQTLDDAYLGEQNQAVDRETRAENTGSFRDSKQTANGKTQNALNHSEPRLSDLGVKMNLMPMGHLGPSSESSATSDYLKDVKQGAQTLLNTREFTYFSFYQRVRRQLEQFWEPGLRDKIQKMFDRGRTLASDREHSTKLLVVLDTEGTIRRVLVESTSGLTDLDQAAIEAFNKAGPFPNPPRGMLEADGTVKVEWEFVLKT